MKKWILQRGYILVFIHVLLLSSCSKNSGQNDQDANPAKSSTPPPTIDNINDLLSQTRDSTYSPKTPMGIHFQSLPTASVDDVKWLQDASKEPSIPQGRSSTLTLKKFSVNLYPYGNPSPADCNQTAMGDCSAISIFAEIAYTNPSFIKSIIKDNGDNTYTVSMYDPTGAAIKVSVSNAFLSTIDNGAIVAVTGKSSVRTWSTILEKALMKYIDIYKLVPTIEGIGSEYASPPFTGNGSSFAFDPSVLNASQLQRAVNVSLAQGKIVIGGFNKENVQVGQSKTVTGHAWAFMLAPTGAIVPSLFVMRNPWGNNNGTDLDGLMYIPNDASITSLIDLRIINAGSAKAAASPTIYTPPKF